MAGKSKDELAKALEAMSSGSAPEPAEESPSLKQPIARHRTPMSDSPLDDAAPGRPKLAVTALSDRQVALKRTLIPVLLTMGVLLPLSGVGALLLGEESPWSDQRWIPVLMIGLGALAAVVTVLTMLQVRHALTSKSAR